MASEIYYDRRAAYEYARRWAYGRNPAYLNFDGMGEIAPILPPNAYSRAVRL